MKEIDKFVVDGIAKQITTYPMLIEASKAWWNSDLTTISNLFGTWDVRPSSRLLFCLEMALNKADVKFDLVDEEDE